MTDSHTPLAELVAYVDGSLGLREAAALEHHVAQCELCASRLQREAWIETTWYEVAEQPAPAKARRAHRTPVLAHLWLAAAAMVLLALFRTGPLQDAVHATPAAETSSTPFVRAEAESSGEEPAVCWASDGEALCSSPLLASVADGAGNEAGEPAPRAPAPGLDEMMAEDAEAPVCEPAATPYTPFHGPASG